MKRRIYLFMTVGLVLAASLAGCEKCLNRATGQEVALYWCNPPTGTVAGPYDRLPASLPLRGPSIGMPPMYAPGMTTTPFLNSDGSTTFCNTTNYGEGGPLTICQ